MGVKMYFGPKKVVTAPWKHFCTEWTIVYPDVMVANVIGSYQQQNYATAGPDVKAGETAMQRLIDSFLDHPFQHDFHDWLFKDLPSSKDLGAPVKHVSAQMQPGGISRCDLEVGCIRCQLEIEPVTWEKKSLWKKAGKVM